MMLSQVRDGILSAGCGVVVSGVAEHRAALGFSRGGFAAGAGGLGGSTGGGACVAAADQGGGRAAGARDPTSIANQERSGGVRPRGHSPGVATARRASSPGRGHPRADLVATRCVGWSQTSSTNGPASGMVPVRGRRQTRRDGQLRRHRRPSHLRRDRVNVLTGICCTADCARRGRPHKSPRNSRSSACSNIGARWSSALREVRQRNSLSRHPPVARQPGPIHSDVPVAEGHSGVRAAPAAAVPGIFKPTSKPSTVAGKRRSGRASRSAIETRWGLNRTALWPHIADATWYASKMLPRAEHSARAGD